MNIVGLIKKANTIITVAGVAVTTYQTMVKTFKWFENKRKGKQDEPVVRPIIKGQ